MYSLSQQPDDSKHRELPGRIDTHVSTEQIDLGELATERYCKYKVKVVTVLALLVVLLCLSVFFGIATVHCKERNEELEAKCTDPYDPPYDDDLHLLEKQKAKYELTGLTDVTPKKLDLTKVSSFLWEEAAIEIQECIVELKTVDAFHNGTRKQGHDVIIGYTIDPNCLKEHKVITQSIFDSLQMPKKKIGKGIYEGFGPIPLPLPKHQ